MRHEIDSITIECKEIENKVLNKIQKRIIFLRVS